MLCTEGYYSCTLYALEGGPYWMLCTEGYYSCTLYALEGGAIGCCVEASYTCLIPTLHTRLYSNMGVRSNS